MIVVFARLLKAVDAMAAALAAGLILAIMLIVAADVLMRYLLNAPFAWSYDLVSLYLLPALFYFALSPSFAVHGHIAVDIVQDRLPDRVRRICQALVSALTVMLFAAIAAVCAQRAWDDFRTDAVTAGAIAWPSWVTNALVTAGAGLLVVRGLFQAVAHVVALVGGDALVPLPSAAGADERGGFE